MTLRFPSTQQPIRVGDWREEAACRATDPAAFSPMQGRRVDLHRAEAVARRWCETCPVRAACTEFHAACGDEVVAGGYWWQKVREGESYGIDLLSQAGAA